VAIREKLLATIGVALLMGGGLATL